MITCERAYIAELEESDMAIDDASDAFRSAVRRADSVQQVRDPGADRPTNVSSCVLEHSWVHLLLSVAHRGFLGRCGRNGRSQLDA